MATLSAKEMRKYDWRPEVFIKKLDDKSPFELNSGRKVMLITPENYVHTLQDGSSAALTELRFSDVDGNLYKLTDFRKTSEFGGKDPGASVAKEDMALKQLRAAMEDAKEKEGSATVRFKIGSKMYDAWDVVTTPGTPKSDFHLVDINNKEIVWISHKDGTTPKHFQQWGGTSPRIEPEIANHPETRAFIAEIRKIFPNGIPEKAPSYMRPIRDPRLKQMAIYGKKFGGPLGQQNTTLMLQGSIKLVRKIGYYVITAAHSHVNGERMTGDYEAVFMTRLSRDRGDHGIKGLRLFIAPKGSRKAIEL